MNSENKIAVVGSGISGLSAAWHISQKNDVHIFEKSFPLFEGRGYNL